MMVVVVVGHCPRGTRGLQASGLGLLRTVLESYRELLIGDKAGRRVCCCSCWTQLAKQEKRTQDLFSMERMEWVREAKETGFEDDNTGDDS